MTTKTKILYICMVFVLCGGGYAAYAAYNTDTTGNIRVQPSTTDTQVQTSANTPTTQQPASQASGTGAATQGHTDTAAAPGTYTIAQVATHNSASSCYTAINGGVYDLTNWINQHPGGPQAILSLCGTDGTAAFENQHGGQRRPANELAGFKIGTLAQ